MLGPSNSFFDKIMCRNGSEMWWTVKFPQLQSFPALSRVIVELARETFCPYSIGGANECPEPELAEIMINEPEIWAFILKDFISECKQFWFTLVFCDVF